MKERNKGIIFSIDAVFALYITLLLMTAFFAVLQTQTQTNDDLLKLSRFARDLHEIRQQDPSAELPSPFLEGVACESAETVGSAFLLVYDDALDEVVVSAQTVCVG